MEDLYDEREVLKGIATGDAAAFARLYRHYWNEVYTLALSFLKSPQQAEDAIQEVFVKLWNKRDTLLLLQDFRPYFLAMTRHAVIDAMRRRRRHILIQGTALLVVSATDYTQEDIFNSKEAARLVQEALSNLPGRQRLIFSLSREQGLTHGQIAALLQLSRKTVANLMTQILNHIREHLSRKGYLPCMILLVIDRYF